MKQGPKRLLTDDQIALILEWKSMGLRTDYIAYEFGVTKRQLYDALKNAKRRGMVKP